MSYSKYIAFPTASSNGSRYEVQFFVEAAGSPPFSLIFGNDSFPVYHGSTLQVYESIVVETSVVEPEFVDVDYLWYVPQKYLGNVQLANYNLAEGDRQYSVDGAIFLKYERQIIERYSYYTVCAPLGADISVGEALNISDCSFALQPTVVFDPGQAIPINGALGLHRFSGSDVVLKGQLSRSVAPIDLTTIFYPLIPGVGLYIRPGVIPLSITHYVEITNQIAALALPYPITPCYTAVPSCQEQFSAAFQSHNQANPGTLWYATLTECQASSGGGCRTGTFVCPTDPAQTFDYYYHGNK